MGDAVGDVGADAGSGEQACLPSCASIGTTCGFDIACGAGERCCVAGRDLANRRDFLCCTAAGLPPWPPPPPLPPYWPAPLQAQDAEATALHPAAIAAICAAGAGVLALVGAVFLCQWHRRFWSKTQQRRRYDQNAWEQALYPPPSDPPPSVGRSGSKVTSTGVVVPPPSTPPPADHGGEGGAAKPEVAAV